MAVLRDAVRFARNDYFHVKVYDGGGLSVRERKAGRVHVDGCAERRRALDIRRIRKVSVLACVDCAGPARWLRTRVPESAHLASSAVRSQ